MKIQTSMKYAYGRALPAGQYVAMVLSAEHVVSAKGNDCIKLSFGVDAEDGGVKIDQTTAFAYEDGIEMILAALAPAVLAEWNENERDSFDVELETWAGIECDVITEVQVYNGKDTAKITKMLPA